ncbi:hypothetical protein K443DRAFT_611635, partial [Laccaria amethystina LaAM-08-1]
NRIPLTSPSHSLISNASLSSHQLTIDPRTVSLTLPHLACSAMASEQCARVGTVKAKALPSLMMRPITKFKRFYRCVHQVVVLKILAPKNVVQQSTRQQTQSFYVPFCSPSHLHRTRIFIQP